MLKQAALPVIIDCGSGYTKMGVAGSSAPTHVIPTVLYRPERAQLVECVRTGTFPLLTSQSEGFASIGNAAIKESVQDASGSMKPVVDGRVADWTDMEMFLHCCYSQYLKIDPSDRACILTEPPLNPANNREKLAELMFETFSVPSLHIGVQAVLALYAYWDGKAPMTGVVVDSGDGVTHVIPVTDGYVSGTSVREIPIGGKDVTKLIAESLQRRGEAVVRSSEGALALNRLSKQIKEKLAYVCLDPLRELKVYDNSGAQFRKVAWTDPTTNTTTDCEIGYERFLGPEVFFQPSLASATVTQSLPVILHDSVMASPIDCRKRLFSNIVLSGGSTLFPNFSTRLQHEVQSLGSAGVAVRSDLEKQRYAVWHGASVLAQTPQFKATLFTKAQYEEIGPRGARDSTITRCMGL